MNTAVYLFGKLGGNYTQYPDDYTRNLFASYQKLSEQDMLAIRRKNAIIYYTYVYKIEEDYVGISLVFNSVFCTDVKALFAFFRKTINDLADKNDWLTRNNGQIILKSLQVDILSKACKELDDKLSSQIDNFAFQVLPPIHVGMDPSAWKIYSQDGITNDTISETLINYNRIYIVGDKIVNTQPFQAADTQADNAYSPNEQHEAKVEETQETEKSVVNNEDNQVASSSSDGTKRLAVLCIGVLVLFVLVLIWLDTSIQESYQDKVERHIEESSSAGNYSSPTSRQNFTETAYGVNMDMIWVEGGSFMMGCTSEQGSNCDDAEKPVHRVALDGFYIGMLEVTQSQWEKVMGTSVYQQRNKANPEWPMRGVGSDYPMYHVSWDEAMEFCHELSRLTGKTYTLPTEAQWEYAARGGSHPDGTKYAGSNSIDAVAWYWDNSGNSTHRCGTKRANGLGIYDMSGNVFEWCKDWYSSPYTGRNNPVGPSSGSYRVCRGGSWFEDVTYNCRVAARAGSLPGDRTGNLGFRVVCLP